MLNAHMNEGELGGALVDCATAGEIKEAAICAFVLARKAQKRHEYRAAENFAEKCLELLRGSAGTLGTLEQCAHPYIAVDGVLIPGLFHEGTVLRDLHMETV